MMQSTIIVTGTDRLYFPLVIELLASIRAHQDGRSMPIGIVDAGMDAAQRQQLEATPNCLVRPFTARSDRLAGAMVKNRKATVDLAKLWLDQLFPEFDTLIFLDADTWVQDWTAVEWLAGAAGEGALALVPTWNRYRGRFPVYWLLGLLPVFRGFNVKAAYHAHLPWPVIRDVGDKADLNAGVFALRRDAPHWARFRHWQEIVLKHGRPFTSDGLSMALGCHLEGLALQKMPEFCNCLGEMLYDPRRNALVDVFYPHQPMGIVHYANHKQSRLDAAARLEVRGIDGLVHRISPRFGAGNFSVFPRPAQRWSRPPLGWVERRPAQPSKET